jgi:hypothetical protein
MPCCYGTLSNKIAPLWERLSTSRDEPTSPIQPSATKAALAESAAASAATAESRLKASSTIKGEIGSQAYPTFTRCVKNTRAVRIFARKLFILYDFNML